MELVWTELVFMVNGSRLMGSICLGTALLKRGKWLHCGCFKGLVFLTPKLVTLSGKLFAGPSFHG